MYSRDKLRLEDDGSRFICALFFLSNGIKNRGFDSDEVYSYLGAKGYGDQQMAREELVQHLEEQDKIVYDAKKNQVRLSTNGLAWARDECSKLPYEKYQYLRNR